jgi:hypothetical protein
MEGRSQSLYLIHHRIFYPAARKNNNEVKDF